MNFGLLIPVCTDVKVVPEKALRIKEKLIASIINISDDLDKFKNNVIFNVNLVFFNKSLLK